MDWPSISIAVPSLNQGKYIERMILSIIKQRYEGRLQVIVADGGSTDGTVDILKKYPQVTWWSKPDNGAFDALKQALAFANGEFIAFMCADDYYLEGVFAKTVPLLVRNSELAFVAASAVILEEDSRRFCLSKRYDLTISNPLDHLTGKCHVTPLGGVIRKSAFQAVGGLSEEYAVGCDAEFFYRVLHYYKGRVIPEYLVVWQQREDQATRSDALVIMDCYKRMVEDYEADSSIPQSHKLNDAEKKELYLHLELFFRDRAGSAAEKETALKIAQSILGETSPHSSELVELAKWVQHSSLPQKKRGRDLPRELTKKVLTSVGLDNWVRFHILRPGSIEAQIASSLDWWRN